MKQGKKSVSAKASKTSSRQATIEDYVDGEFEAAHSVVQIEEMERAAQDKSHGVNRRLALAIMTKSKADLVKAFTGDEGTAEAFVSGLEAIGKYAQHLRAVLDTVVSAQTRLTSAALTAAALKP